MNDHRTQSGTARMRQPGVLKRSMARVAVLGLVVGGAIAMTAGVAGADSPNPGGTQTATAVLNNDGSLTVTVSGASWAWNNKTCTQLHDGNKIPGWQVVWGDNTENLLVDEIYVGDAENNVVSIDTDTAADVQCTDLGGNVSGGAFAGSISHTYSAEFIAENDIEACVVTYDVHEDELPDGTGDHSLVAGGEDHNDDNSIETNGDTLEGNCTPIEIEPDVAVVKTGPDSAIVGQSFAYTITASNTGGVDADDVTITDVIPAGADFVSADSPCVYNAGTRTVTCELGTLAVGEDVTVHITVTPNTSGTLVNTATVTPDDETPNDNTSTWTIGDVQVAAAGAVTGTPKLTG